MAPTMATEKLTAGQVLWLDEDGKVVHDMMPPPPPVEAANPNHYKSREVECWDWYEMIMTDEEFCGHMKGLICKYLYRVGDKGDPVEDLQKIGVYVERWIRKLKEVVNEN